MVGEVLADLGGRAINVCCAVRREGQEVGRVSASRTRSKLRGKVH